MTPTYRAELPRGPLTGLAWLRGTLLVRNEGRRNLSMGQAAGIGASMVWMMMVSPFGLDPNVSVGVAVGIVLLASLFFQYTRPISRWNLVVANGRFSVVPVAVPPGRGEPELGAVLLQGGVHELVLEPGDGGLRVGNGTQHVELDVALDGVALQRLCDEVREVQQAFGDPSMVPNVLASLQAAKEPG